MEISQKKNKSASDGAKNEPVERVPATEILVVCATYCCSKEAIFIRYFAWTSWPMFSQGLRDPLHLLATTDSLYYWPKKNR
jgi:hypothetical protein